MSQDYSPGADASVLPPINRTLTAATLYTIYNRSTTRKRHHEIVISNTGVNPLYYCINGDASVDVFTDVLAGSLVANDGTGARVVIDKYKRIEKVTVFSPLGTSIAGLVALRNDCID